MPQQLHNPISVAEYVEEQSPEEIVDASVFQLMVALHRLGWRCAAKPKDIKGKRDVVAGMDELRQPVDYLPGRPKLCWTRLYIGCATLNLQPIGPVWKGTTRQDTEFPMPIWLDIRRFFFSCDFP